MTVFPPGGMYFLDNQGDGWLRQPLQLWALRHPSWNFRLSNVEGRLRRSTAEEVATELLQDPTFLEAIGVFTSKPAQSVEQAYLDRWMPSTDAELMTAGLTNALKYVRNQNVPPWKRGEVLIGVGVAVVGLSVIILVVRHAQKSKE
jgi:hypothetical protein